MKERGDENMRILIVRGKSQYDATGVFFDEIKTGLEEKGAKTEVLDATDQEKYLAVRSTLADKTYDVILTFNGTILEENFSLKNILLKNNVVYCTILMDHPYMHHFRLKNPYAPMLVYSPDFNHVDYLKTYYPYIQAIGFLPHAGCQSRKMIPYQERNVSISFSGSYSSPDKIAERFRQFSPEIESIFWKIINFLQENVSYTVEDAVLKILSRENFQISPEETAGTLSEFRLVDTYIRAYFRDKVIRTIVSKGIPVDVYGSGWENFEGGENSALRIHGQIGFYETLEVMANSKISLNVMPWFKNGSHDRVFTAMLCGAVPLTDPSIYLENECTDGENVIFYHLEELEKLPDMISHLLEGGYQGVSLEKIAENGRIFAEQKHTWKHRGYELFEDLHSLLETDF
ncbi:MAG: glycosyltransferase [Lachnospiraceae bacterium]|nr:glycosyltransferase [Lachnospiraceae bacterium]